MGRGSDTSNNPITPTRDENRTSLLVDRRDPRITNAIREAPIYKKHVRIKARAARVGEDTTTILEDGYLETTDTAVSGDWVVTNPSGEKYIVSAGDFQKRYEPTEEEGVFQARGYVRAINNPFQTDISLPASWGEIQRGEADCLLAVTCSEEGQIDEDPYIIDRASFLETYRAA